MKENKLLRKIKAEYPDITWKNYQYFTNGWDHEVIILDKKIVFRAPRDINYQNRLKHEIALTNYLKPLLKVRIPEYKYISSDNTFAGYDMLKGKELTTARFKRLTASEKKNIAGQIAEFNSILHATPGDIVEYCEIENEAPDESLHELLQKADQVLFPNLDKKDIYLIEAFFTKLKAISLLDYTKKPVHSDLTEDHILWDSKQKQVSIIDFSDCRYGDPAIDFAGILIYGEEFTQQVFDLYLGNKDNSVLERARLYFKRIPLYIMIDSFLGFPCTFEEGYSLFRQRF